MEANAYAAAGRPAVNRTGADFIAKPGFGLEDLAPLAEIKAPEKPKLGYDEALGVYWTRLRGKEIGIRYGTLRQRKHLEKQTAAIHEGAGLSDEEKYELGLRVFEPFLVLPDAAHPEGVRSMTLEEMEDRVDLVDFDPITRIAFPAVSPLQALADAGVNPK